MTSAVAWETDEGNFVHFLIVVTRDRRTFSFDFRAQREGVVDPGNASYHDFEIVHWIELTDVYEGTGYRRDIKAALTVLDNEAG